MNRNDVIDVLSVVAAATRRTVGETDVDVWQAIIGEDDKQLALKAVRDHLADCPGVWLEPGHVHQRVRAIRRDQLDREPAAAREARQEALAAKAAEDFQELAERKSLPTVTFTRPSRMPGVNAKSVRCPWCRAAIGSRCVVPATGMPLTKTDFHDARKESAALAARDDYAKGRMNHG